MPGKKDARAPGKSFKDIRKVYDQFFLRRRPWNLTAYDGPWDELPSISFYLQKHIACQPKIINIKSV